MNTFLYAGANPVMAVDPTGEWWSLVARGASTVVTKCRQYCGSVVTRARQFIQEARKNRQEPQQPSSAATETTSANTCQIQTPRTQRVEPNQTASGPHTTWKTDPQTGQITRHETWTPNPRNPTGWDSYQSTDLVGRAHRNKMSLDYIGTPHTQSKNIPGGVRPADPFEIPSGVYKW